MIGMSGQCALRQDIEAGRFHRRGEIAANPFASEFGPADMLRAGHHRQL